MSTHHQNVRQPIGEAGDERRASSLDTIEDKAPAEIAPPRAVSARPEEVRREILERLHGVDARWLSSGKAESAEDAREPLNWDLTIWTVWER